MKNETKHTLETWHVDKNDPRLCLAGTEHLCTVYRQTVDGKDIIREAVAENVSAKDARLIAAAPDLLATLQMAADELKARLELTGLNTDFDAPYEACIAAIAKAKGGEA